MSGDKKEKKMRASLFCKTFRDDFSYVANLLDSYHAHVDADIDLILSMPSKDVALAKATLPISERCSIVEDESYTDNKSSEIGGWMQQQVCKLSLFRVCESDLCMCVDSDTYFVGNLRNEFFVESDGRAKMVASEISANFDPNNGALISYLKGGNRSRIQPISTKWQQELDYKTLVQRSLSEPFDSCERAALIFDFYGVPDNLSFMPSQIFSVKALAEMYQDVCEANDLCISDLICISPWEYIWYGCWVIWKKAYEFSPIISPVLHFATNDAVAFAKASSLTEKAIAPHFVAIAMAARHHGLIRLGANSA